MTLFQAFGQFAGAGAAAPAGAPGMVLVTPSSIGHTGTSASIGTNGGISFTTITELNINGCFTSSFDNYLIVFRAPDNAASDSIYPRLRASGSDATGTDYTQQRLRGDGASVSGQRSTSQTRMRMGSTVNPVSGFQMYFYGPALAQPTAFRSISVDAISSARIDEYACTHSLSTSYDGVTFVWDTGNAQTGNVAVYGIRS